MKQNKLFQSHRDAKHFLRNTAAAAAALTVCFSISVNTLPAFAAEVKDLPAIGSLAHVFTIDTGTQQKDNTTISVSLPRLEATEQGQTDISFINDFNKAVQEIAAHYTAQAEKQIADEKAAFLATGGTEAEWDARDINVNVQYEIKSQTPATLSLVLTTSQGWYNYSDVQHFFNLNLEKGTVITLKDLLGDDYIQIANESIKQQMKEQMASDENIIYWTEEEGVPVDYFQTISDDTHFYINEAGQPVVVFDKYEVAPGYMGAPEFVIPLPAK